MEQSEEENFFNLTIRLNDSRGLSPNESLNCLNSTSLECVNHVFRNLTDHVSSDEEEKPEKVYWGLLLIFFPIAAVFGNILVILSVYRERSLQSVTNYFIVSLAVADLLVAGVVMPFAVYFLVSYEFRTSVLSSFKVLLLFLLLFT